jgi:hypothetical protein
MGQTFTTQNLVIHPLYRQFSSYKLASLLNILTALQILSSSTWLRQLKGSLTRDFQNQVDLTNQSPPLKRELESNVKFLRKFAEIPFVCKFIFRCRWHRWTAYLPMPLTPLINIHLRISTRIFVQIPKLRGPGKIDTRPAQDTEIAAKSL